MKPVDRRSRQCGFSLLEVLVAFMILTLSLGVLFRIFSSGLQNLTISEGYSQAVLLAESRLSEVGLSEPLEQGESQGEWGEGFVWRQSVVPYLPWEDEMELTKPIAAYWVTVVVSWGEQGKQRQLSLRSLRLKAESVFGAVDDDQG